MSSGDGLIDKVLFSIAVKLLLSPLIISLKTQFLFHFLNAEKSLK